MSKITGVNITMRPADILIADGQNARTTSGMDKESLFDLGQSMEDLGQINPVHVNCVGGKEFHLIAGERRLRAAIASGEKFIQCTRHDDLDALMIWQIQITENDPRYRVNLNPIEEANGYQRGIDLGMTVKQIAKKIGASEDTIARRLRLLKLNNNVQQMITRDINPLPVHQAILLAGLDDSRQLELARKAAPITGPVASETQVREWVDELKGKRLDFEDDDRDERKDTGLPRQTKSRDQRPDARSKRPVEIEKTSISRGSVVITGEMVLEGNFLGINGLMTVKNFLTGRTAEMKWDHEFLLEGLMLTKIKPLFFGSGAEKPAEKKQAETARRGRGRPRKNA